MNDDLSAVSPAIADGRDKALTDGGLAAEAGRATARSTGRAEIPEAEGAAATLEAGGAADAPITPALAPTGDSVASAVATAAGRSIVIAL